MLIDLILLDSMNNSTSSCILRINTRLPQELDKIDRDRLYEKTRKLLSLLHKKSFNTLHQFDTTEFTINLEQHELWKLNESMKLDHVITLLFKRLSDFHEHTFNLCFEMEKYILVNKNDDFPEFISDIYNGISGYIEILHLIHREVKEYTRLLESLVV
jgi:hypothetical protein